MKENERDKDYYEVKTEEGLAILKWLSKATIFVVLVGAIIYFGEGEVGISSLVGGLLFAGLVRYLIPSK